MAVLVFSTISSARAFSLGLVVGNHVDDDLGDAKSGVMVDGFGAGIISSSLSYSSMIVWVGADVAVILLMLGDGILAYMSPFFMALR